MIFSDDLDGGSTQGYYELGKPSCRAAESYREVSDLHPGGSTMSDGPSWMRDPRESTPPNAS